MGVDFYTCENSDCGYNFPDCGDYFGCDCGHHYCSPECGGRQLSAEIEDNQFCDYSNDYPEEITTCIICRGEVIPNEDLLQFLLKKYSLTRQEATIMYNKENSSDEDQDESHDN